MRWTALLLIAIACGQGGPAAEVKGVDGFPGLLDADGTDRDGDGLSDEIEETPRTILIDSSGFGFDKETKPLEERVVTSDPRKRDTDGDGLEDHEEWLIRTDPRSVDTDGDGLSDYDEWNQYFTSPVSVDSDGDARGANGELPPNGFLFDGIELRDMGTSPTLSDTDGDGVPDSDEIDHPFRSAVIAELPQLEFTRTGEIDVRLGVEYEDSKGQEKQYGTSTVETNGTDSTSAKAYTYSETYEHHLNFGLEFSAEKEFKTNSAGVKATATFSAEYGHNWSWTTDNTRESSEGVSRSLAEESVDYTTDSASRTEITSRGEITLGMKLLNASDSIAFRVTNLGLTLQYVGLGEDPKAPPVVRVLGTLVPDLPSVTLAPGQETGALAFRATDVNVSVLKDFMANPQALSLDTSYFDLENAEGINFAFLTENAYSQTARVVIDYGNGTVDRFRVATNVARNKDGTYAGIRLMTALTDSLRLPVQTQLVQLPSGQWIPRVTKIGSRSSNVDDPKGFWTVQLNEGAAIGPGLGFEDIVLRAGDYATISYFEDEDLDGLSVQLEESFATRPDCDDCDEDGLDDGDEAVRGWIAGDDTAVDDWPVERARIEDAEETLRTSGLPQADYDAAQAVLDGFILHDSRRGYPRWVRSNPTLVDSDFDGLKDADERAAHTDPTNPDTDGDNLRDGDDPYPLIPARTLRVNASAPAGGDGATWDAAIARLEDALAEAASSNADTDPTNDVSEIWVAAGRYSRAAGQAFELVDRVGIFGGFEGNERARAGRNPDPLTNGTVIAPEAGEPGSSRGLVSAADVGPGTALDGFALSEGAVGLRLEEASPVLRNVVFSQNETAAVYAERSSPRFEDCTFLENGLFGYNGAAIGMRGGAATIERCVFESNRSPSEGGAIHGWENVEFQIRDCRFSGNAAGWVGIDNVQVGHGGAIFIASGRLRVESCVFENNTAEPVMFEGGWKNGGAGAIQVGAETSGFLEGDNRDRYPNAWSRPLEASIVNCVFRGNSGWGGAVFAPRDWRRSNVPGRSLPKLSMVNCTLAGNEGFFAGAVTVGPELNVGAGSYWQTYLTNTIAYGNRSRSAAETYSRDIEFRNGYGSPNRNVDLGLSWMGSKLTNCLVGIRTDHVIQIIGSNLVFERRSDVSVAATSLFGVNPQFRSATNLRLATNSPAIDAGTSFVDIDISTAGVQPLPEGDLDMEPRRSDGNGNGQARVDIGAYEFQR
ncbi:MAG: right-handed parallel beta-helix repeat-containing protein [Planctomycetota bacterium]|jgi:hypothetical protein